MVDQEELRAPEIAKVDLSDTLGRTFGGICLVSILVFVVLWVVWGMGREGLGVRLNFVNANAVPVQRDGTTRDCT